MNEFLNQHGVPTPDLESMLLAEMLKIVWQHNRGKGGQRDQRSSRQLVTQNRCGRPWGRPAARKPGLGTGRGGDVTGVANSLLECAGPFRDHAREFACQRADTVVGACGSPSATQVFGSDCDWRFTKREPGLFQTSTCVSW